MYRNQSAIQGICKLFLQNKIAIVNIKMKTFVSETCVAICFIEGVVKLFLPIKRGGSTHQGEQYCIGIVGGNLLHLVFVNSFYKISDRCPSRLTLLFRKSGSKSALEGVSNCFYKLKEAIVPIKMKIFV